MKGDKLIIEEGHVRAAHGILKLLLPQLLETPHRFIVTIAGESGSGKSEIAAVLAQLLAEKDIKSVVLQQDDYFVYPPKTNAAMRKKDIGHVGPSEVHLELLDQNLQDIIQGKDAIEKPLVIYDEDRITRETIRLEGIKLAIVEGTYTSLLENVDQRIFIDRTNVDTRETRRRRAREEQDDYLEQILEIEHAIISQHKARADIIVTKNYGAKRAKAN